MSLRQPELANLAHAMVGLWISAREFHNMTAWFLRALPLSSE
jgi:hypothetical protein